MGNKVDLYADESEMRSTTVESVTSPHQFVVAGDSAVKNLFVYGHEVNDFRTVDYDAIAMLNVSATQQVKREKDAEVNALQAEHTSLRARLERLESLVERAVSAEANTGRSTLSLRERARRSAASLSTTDYDP